MAKDAAQNSQANGAEAGDHPIVARQRSEFPVDERKWPKAWRLLFLLAAATMAWVCFVVVARWI